MRNLLSRFWREEEGMGVVEIVIIISVLVAVALLFRTQLIKFATDLMNKVFKVDNIPDPTTT